MNANHELPEGLSMVADSNVRTSGGVGAGIQVEAAANPKESLPWLPAPASTGLHADIVGIYTHTHSESTTRRNIHD